MTNSFGRFNSVRDKYNYFSHEINLSTDQDYGLFIHEYYHHLQNVTTIFGAERMNLFVQIIAHLSSLGSKNIELFSPIDKWMSVNKGPLVQVDLYNISQHISMWNYLEKRHWVKDFFLEEHVDQLINGPPYEQGTLNPCYVDKVYNKLIGFPIGGLVLSESSAYSLQCLCSNQTRKSEQIEPHYSRYEYTLIPYLLESLVDSSEDVFLVSFIFCELAMSLSTPTTGFKVIYEYLCAQELPIKRPLHILNTLLDEFRDTIKEVTSLEMELIDEIRKRSVNLNSDIKDLIYWQCKQIETGLSLRLENPFFLTDKLVNGGKRGLEELLNIFPPTSIRVADNDPVHLNWNYYDLLKTFTTVFTSICFDPEYLIEEYSNDLTIKKIISDPNQYEISILKDSSGHTNTVGFALRMMNLQNFKISLLK